VRPLVVVGVVDIASIQPCNGFLRSLHDFKQGMTDKDRDRFFYKDTRRGIREGTVRNTISTYLSLGLHAPR